MSLSFRPVVVIIMAIAVALSCLSTSASADPVVPTVGTVDDPGTVPTGTNPIIVTGHGGTVGATIRVTIDAGTESGCSPAASVDSGGSWSCSLPGALDAGEHTLGFVAVDPADENNRSVSVETTILVSASAFGITSATTSAEIGEDVTVSGAYDTTAPNGHVDARLVMPGAYGATVDESSCTLTAGSGTFSCALETDTLRNAGQDFVLRVKQTSTSTVLTDERSIDIVLPPLRGTSCANPYIPSGTNGLVSVASYNITGVGPSKNTSGWRWQDRREGVTNFLARCTADVYGLQEASSAYLDGYVYPKTRSQFEQVRDWTNNRLQQISPDTDDHYELVNAGRNQCKYNPPYDMRDPDCVYNADNASNDNRILYNTATTKLIREGYGKLSSLATPRTVAWAVFEPRFGPKNRYIVATTHLEAGPKNATLRIKQVKQALAHIVNARKNYPHPVVFVGDFNANRYSVPTSAADHAQSGSLDLTDILGHDRTKFYKKIKKKGKKTRKVLYRRGTCNVIPQAKSGRYGYYVPYTPQARIRTWYNTSTASQFKNLCKASPAYVGNSIDYIFVSKSVRPKAFETVVDNSGSSGYRRLYDYSPSNRVLPSDHNMILAKLQIPSS